MEEVSLPLDALVRSLGVNATSPHAFFLGAGASMSSGIPTAWRCIWEWKRKIFLTNNPGLEKEFTELSLSSVQDRIQRWLDAKGFPPRDDPSEYCEYIKHCFPIAEDRRRYFQGLVQKAKPHLGYRLLCVLARDGMLRSVWTTNFDGLTARAAARFELTPIEVGIECKDRLARQPARNELLCVSLHGDYRYDELKNTPEELRSQDKHLRASLIAEAQHSNFIVCGYSGRDQSVMETLTDAYTRSGSGTLYWCGHGDSPPPPVVLSLIQKARNKGRNAFYIPSYGFDDLLIRVSLHCLSGAFLTEAQAVTAEHAPNPEKQTTPFVIRDAPLVGVIKSNSFPIQCPSDVLSFTVDRLPEKGTWDYLDNLTRGHDIVAVPYRGKILSFGTVDAIKDLFGTQIRGPIERTPIHENELLSETGTIVSLLRTAILKCLAKIAGIKAEGRRVIWDTRNGTKSAAGGKSCFMHQSAILSLRTLSGKQYLVIKPSFVFADEQGHLLSEEEIKTQKLSALGYQHNDKFNAAVKFWADRVIPPSGQSFEFPPNCGSTFRFVIGRSPLVAKICDPSERSGKLLKPGKEKLINQTGLRLKEPELVFAHKVDELRWAHDVHPIRGILDNRPYDFSLTKSGLADRVSIGIVCPKTDEHVFSSYLQGLLQSHQPQKSEQDYLLPFPGFPTAFGLPIQIPRPGERGWLTCPDPPVTFGHKDGAIELGRSIRNCVESLRSSIAPNLVVICIPERWSPWRGYETDTERMDLHDSTKAYCVHKGIPTQFLEEHTLQNQYDCRIAWWLSLALYVKSMRTPWVLDSLASGTAFVGLGFSIDRKAVKGEHVVVGCSHIYSEKGEGLQYRLGKIDNPIVRGRNPFLSLEDARRVGDGIRQLFFDAMLRLPDRVVIHKRTPFNELERKGLVQGLAGIKTIDMVEISIEENLRYLASVIDQQGDLKEDTFPVRRGTTVLLDDWSALLWGHGVTMSVKPGWKYYQGKRRIPAPLLLRRYLGTTPLEVLCGEILGLSKMDWNTFDMYAKLPATIQSSNEIARIGSLLERFGRNSYDYRLFM